ncbi:MAG: hypothetical protein KF684_03395 [Phycisphaeraceae bacterium]|nr:hypothetical protein [Phycisphaeraceae bacterium]
MLYVDIPTRSDLTDLAVHRAPMSVTIYLPTTPVTTDSEADRILLKNLASDAISQLESADADKRKVREIAEELDDLIDDDEFWRFAANGLAVFVTPENLRTFRVPTALESGFHVADRFHLKPLLRATTFCNSGYVLALAEGSVRLVEVCAELPATTVKVEDMPKDAASAAGQSSIAGRQHRGRLVGSEGQKVRLRQYARKIDSSLRGLLSGGELPLVLASVDNLAAIYRSVNSYPYLSPERIATSPERISEADLAAAARPLFDNLYRQRLADWHSLFKQRNGEGRASTDVAQAARGATYGLVQTLLVDKNAVVPGSIDEQSGAIHLDDAAHAGNYGVVDEIARRTLLYGGEVLSVRAADMPSDKPVAAIFRYPF